MTTATPKKTTNTEPLQTQLGRVEANVMALVREADDVLTRLAHGDAMTDQDHMILTRAGYQKRSAIQLGVGRMTRVLDARRKAGTKADRQALRTTIENAEAGVASRVPQIDAEIERLQNEKANLLELVRKPTEQLAVMDRAHSELKSVSLLPPALENEYRNITRLQREAAGAVSTDKSALDRNERLLAKIAEGKTHVVDLEFREMKQVTPDLIETIQKRRDEAAARVAGKSPLVEACRCDADDLLHFYCE